MALTEEQQTNIGTGLSVLQAAYEAATGASGDGVIVVEEEPTFFELYGPWILGGSALVLVAAILRR
jgi:hypothetical protein